MLCVQATDGKTYIQFRNPFADIIITKTTTTTTII